MTNLGPMFCDVKKYSRCYGIYGQL